MTANWVVRLALQAEQDYFDILRWTSENFGARQAEIYAETLLFALDALKDGPEILGVKAHNEIESGIRSLHVARNGRKGRHFVVFRVGGEYLIDVLRLLHDSMDLTRHIPAANDQAH